MRFLYVLLFFTCLSFNLSSQEYADVWLQAWVKNEGTSNTLAGRNLSVTVGDFVYDAVHQLNDHDQHDLVVSKTTLKGTVQWIDTFNLSATTANMLLGDMTVDGNGDIIVTGAVYNGSNNYDVITVKYTGAGMLLWHQLYNGTASSYDGGLRVITDNSNNIYVTGGATSTANAMDMLILAYNSYGTLNWSEVYDGHGNFDAGSHLAISGTLSVVGVSQTTDPTLWRIASRKYQLSNGALIVGVESSDVALSEVRDVVKDSNGDIYVTGWKFTPGQGQDAVMVKWSDGANSVDWEVTYNGTASGNDFMNSIAVASNGDVVVGGYTTTGSGDRDGLLLKYSTTGQFLWEQTCSGASGEDDEITDVLLDETAGEIYLAGQVREYADADYLFERRKLSDGTLEHQEIFAGWVGGDDKAEVLLKDADSGVILSGKTAAGNGSEKPTTVRYKKETYFLPPNTEEPNASLPYIHNYEQLVQTDGTVADKVRYYVQGSPAKYLGRKKMHLVLSSVDTVPSTPDTLCRVEVDFSGDKGQRIYAMDKRASYHNYYLGHINEGRTKVALTDEILHRDAWLGIDILHGSNNAGVTYDFIVQPGVDPNLIEMTFTGHTSLTINGAGELEIGTALGTITWPAPQASLYDAQGGDYPVLTTTAYTIVGTDKVKLNGLSINATRYQVVKVRKAEIPSAGGGDGKWITYYGDMNEPNPFQGDRFSCVGSTPSDGIVAGGINYDEEFPVAAGTTQIYGTVSGNNNNAFFAAFGAARNFLYATIFGGSAGELLNDIAVFGSDFFVVGETRSDQFPQDSGPVDAQDVDGFIGKFSSATGERILLRLLSGTGREALSAIDVTKSGSVYTGGFVTTEFPLTSIPGAYNQIWNGAGDEDLLIIEYDTDLNELWSSYFGGDLDEEQLYDIVAKEDDAGFYILGGGPNLSYHTIPNQPPGMTDTGFPNYRSSGDTQFPFNNGGTNNNETDLFIGEFDGNNQLLWTTFLGGHGSEIQPSSSHSKLSINPNNPLEITIVGATEDFSTFPANPATTGYRQNLTGKGDFIVRFIGRRISWVTGFGCLSSGDFYSDESTVNYTPAGDIIVTGLTSCPPPDATAFCVPPTTAVFPYCPPAATGAVEYNQATPNGGLDAYIATFDAAFNLNYASYFGGNSQDAVTDAIFEDGPQILLMVGRTFSDTNFPISLPMGAYAQGTLAGPVDGFLAELCFDQTITDTYIVRERSNISLGLFPNPTSGTLYFDLPEEPGLSQQQMTIYNAMGQLLPASVQINHGSSRGEIDLQHLPAGTYFYRWGKYAGQIIKVQ